MLRTVELSKVIVPPRQRESHTPAHIAQLKTSILSKGLLHPPVLTSDLNLVAGFGRLSAIKELHEDGLSFTCDATPIPTAHLPYVLIGDLTPGDLAEAELEENLLRANLTWQETNKAKVLIHQLRNMQSPGISTSEVAREMAVVTGKSHDAERIRLQQALVIEEHKELPAVKAAKSHSEAYQAIMDKQAAEFRRDLYKRRITRPKHDIRLGDCREILKQLPANSVDLILTDPPYGIKADEMKKTEKHFYNDSPSNAIDICKCIIREGFRVLKPRANLIMFCDVEWFKELRDYAAQQAYTSWRTPLIWTKGNEGHAPWGRTGFARTYEMYLFCTKGQKGTKGLGADVKAFARPSRPDRTHAAEKPISLLTNLISITSEPGDVVLDPCCGSGAVVEAAELQKCTCIGIELNPEYHALACARTLKALEGPGDPPPEPTDSAPDESIATDEELLS